jgi:hypothetical protein
MWNKVYSIVRVHGSGMWECMSDDEASGVRGMWGGTKFTVLRRTKKNFPWICLDLLGFPWISLARMVREGRQSMWG